MKVGQTLSFLTRFAWQRSALVPSPLYPGERVRVRGGFGTCATMGFAPHPSPLPRVQGRGSKIAARTACYRMVAAVLCSLCLCADKPADPAPYANNFQACPVGKAPEDLMILNGAFAVVQDGAGKALELAPDPLDGDGFLFGPAGQVTGNASARVFASAVGKRLPEFGVGSNDAGGYKLIVVPAQGTLELRKGEDAEASVPYAWKSASWTHLALSVAKNADGTFTVAGKAWPDGAAEPHAPLISLKAPAEPPAGRASAWGMCYSGTPIRFADLAWKPK